MAELWGAQMYLQRSYYSSSDSWSIGEIMHSLKCSAAPTTALLLKADFTTDSIGFMKQMLMVVQCALLAAIDISLNVQEVFSSLNMYCTLKCNT